MATVFGQQKETGLRRKTREKENKGAFSQENLNAGSQNALEESPLKSKMSFHLLSM